MDDKKISGFRISAEAKNRVRIMAAHKNMLIGNFVEIMIGEKYDQYVKEIALSDTKAR